MITCLLSYSYSYVDFYNIPISKYIIILNTFNLINYLLFYTKDKEWRLSTWRILFYIFTNKPILVNECMLTAQKE